MKTNPVICFILIISGMVSALRAQQSDPYNDVMQRTAWWREARFGMFIHFGVYAVPARGEWVKSVEKMTTEDYQIYVDAFNPVDFDAKAWAKTARLAGMKYAVLTAKHHDGYCLFDSKHTDYKLSARFGGRDLVREFLDAFRAEGLKVGLYYSLIDWHHPDYPNVGNHPQAGDKEYSQRKFNWDNYLTYMHNQVEELVTRYGKIDIIWFDYSFDEYQGEKWRATELVEMVRRHQPGIILDNRLGINHGTVSGGREYGYGDFETPEQGIPDAPLLDGKGRSIPWETCLTLNNNWGYSQHDNVWKSPQAVIHALVNCVSKNGNLLLNVGPDARGNIPEQSVAILTEVGRWMQKNGESIYGCGASELPKPDWGRYTQKGNTLFAHWMHPVIGPLNIKGIGEKAAITTLLASGAELPTATSWWGNQGPDNFFINTGTPIHFTFPLPDSLNTVIRIQMKTDLKH